MDPVSLGISAIGLGLKIGGSLFGSSDASKFAEQYNQQEQQKFKLEQQVQDQHAQAMELSSRRQQLETFRNTQRARAMGLNAAVNQGAQYGSGLAGGQASIQNQGLFNSQGIALNTMIGENIFGLNRQISSVNATESSLKAQYQQSQATDQGIASLGGAILGSAGTIGNIGGYLSSNVGKLFMGGGSPSGY